MNRLLLHGLPLWLAYVGVTSDLAIRNLILGALVAGSVMLMLPPPRSRRHFRETGLAFVLMLRYALAVAWDVFINGLVVARIVLTPRLPVKPGFVDIPTHTTNRWIHALCGHGITLSPGQMVVDIDRQGVLTTHCLNASGPEAIREGQRWRIDRVVRILEPPAPDVSGEPSP